MSEQARVPEGVPTGGRFATSQRPESNVRLAALDGSFRYPPFFNTAEEVIDFWSNVEIPDEVLAFTEDLYKDTWAPAVSTWPEVYWEHWGYADWLDSNPEPSASDTAAHAVWEGNQRANEEETVQRLRSVLEQRPEVLDRRDVRPLARATAMFRNATRELDDAGYRAVLAHQVTLTTGPTSVRKAAVESGLGGWASLLFEDSLGDAPQAGVATKDDVRTIVEDIVKSEIQKQNRALDKALDELWRGIGGTGNAIIDTLGRR